MKPDYEERKKLIKSVRSELCTAYTTSKTRLDVGFQLIQEFKNEINTVKGYAGMDFIIEKEKVEDLKKELMNLYKQNEDLIKKSGLHAIYASSDFQIKNEDGVFETDPEHKVVVFALELNEGDYKTMAFPLSEAEEDGMRADYAAKKAAEVERNTVGPRHFS